MRRALALARRGIGCVSPNPLVGAVVVRRGRIVGEGWHRIYGGQHAEVVALGQAGKLARGATLYTNLEPCAHQGKTPPCTRAILDAGVTRVVAALQDPDPRVKGRGFRQLRRAGVGLATGLMVPEAEEVNAGFLKRMRSGLPWVLIKAGMTMDGRIAASGGDSQWITSAASRTRGHRLRGALDAILVGAGTARADDPLLSWRGGAAGRRPLRQPLRVVLDGCYSVPPSARLLTEPGGGPVIFYGLAQEAGRRRALERAGAEVVAVRGRQGRPDAAEVLADLGRRGITSVLVEGGGRVAWALLEAGLVDALCWFVAPMLLGGGVPVLAGSDTRKLDTALRIENMRITRVGEDWQVVGQPVGGGHRRRPGRR